MREKTREKVMRDKQDTMREKKNLDDNQTIQKGPSRDEKGRVMFTKPEMQLVDLLTKSQQDGILRYNVIPQFEVKIGGQPYSLDFAIPQLRIGIEADGEMFHSSTKQVQRDKSRDMQLTQAGWTIIRFKDTEIEKKGQQVIGTILKNITQKETLMKKFLGGDKGNGKKQENEKDSSTQS